MAFWQILVYMVYFMLLAAWLWLMIITFTDIFRDHSLSGASKAVWCLFILVLPWVGILAYLLARGRGMSERRAREAQASEQAFRKYIREAAGEATEPATPGIADEIAKLADLRDRGVISTADYEAAKTRLLAGTRVPGEDELAQRHDAAVK